MPTLRAIDESYGEAHGKEMDATESLEEPPDDALQRNRESPDARSRDRQIRQGGNK
jgi:hypothetical protein